MGKARSPPALQRAIWRERWGKPLGREEAQKSQNTGISYGKCWLQELAQILGDLRSLGIEHGLLINFGTPKFEIMKHALSRIGEASRPGGLIGGVLFLFASLAPFRGL